MEYFNERDRGYHDREDLYVAGHFIVEAKEGDVIYFTAGLNEYKAKDIENSFNSLIKKESADTMETVLLQTARNMFVEKDGKSYMMAGYPW
ncbi:MAG: glycogen debranching enzyme N-terminal domain-containing protein, partial [Paludibacteraceae bacterium]|nr:glycogen debranching enzyme N-terminal domain-containing protein [Paludibacteraceae bacterium]